LHPIEEYILPYYQLNINASEYVIGTGFGKTTDDSPCRVSPGHIVIIQPRLVVPIKNIQ